MRWLAAALTVGLVCGGMTEAHGLALRDRIRERIGVQMEQSEAADTEAADAPGANSVFILLPFDGGERRYLLHVPSGRPRAALPLVVMLHGYGSNPAQQEKISGFSALADREGFAVAYPLGEGRKPMWRFMGHDDEDERFIRAVVDDVARRVPLDRGRIYAAGISNGAQMSARLACTAGDVFAAVAPVSGNYMDYPDCKTKLPVSAVLFHGTNDRVLPYTGRFVQFSPQHWAESMARRNGCESKPIIVFREKEVTAQRWDRCRDKAEVMFYTIGGKGHSWPGSAMPEAITTKTIDASAIIWEFFKRHARS